MQLKNGSRSKTAKWVVTRNNQRRSVRTSGILGRVFLTRNDTTWETKQQKNFNIKAESSNWRSNRKIISKFSLLRCYHCLRYHLIPRVDTVNSNLWWYRSYLVVQLLKNTFLSFVFCSCFMSLDVSLKWTTHSSFLLDGSPACQPASLRCLHVLTFLQMKTEREQRKLLNSCTGVLFVFISIISTINSFCSFQNVIL